jgi:PAS domain S-box-containing protein
MEDIHPEDRERHMTLNARAFASGNSYRDTFRYRKADGDYVWVRQKAMPQYASKGKEKIIYAYLGVMILLDEPPVR